ncbi:hypothetical protein Hdeb2414_s0010g00348331 [Helianthus debilis subsp. tardiflorus]
MWILLLVTFFNWLTWFLFLLFHTDWMGRDVYGGKVGAQLYNCGFHAGALGLMVNSVVFGLVLLCIELLARWVGCQKRLWVSLLTRHLLWCRRLSFCYICRSWCPARSGTFSVPCALVSIFCNNSGAGLDCGLLAERVTGLANGRWQHACIRGRRRDCCF